MSFKSHKYTQSTELSSRKAAVFYPPVGDGRDSYILVDNGGTTTSYYRQGVPELGTFMKFGSFGRTIRPTAPHHTKKYNADGTGRDTYVLDGQVESEFARDVRNFYGTLRAYHNPRESKFRLRLQTENSQEKSFNKKTKKLNDSKEQISRFRVRALSVPRRRNEKYQTTVGRFRDKSFGD